MSWSLEVFKEFFHLVKVSRQSEIDRLYLEWPSRRLFRRETETQEPVNNLLERFPGFPDLLVEKSRDVVI